jgi:hypothetical protein
MLKEPAGDDTDGGGATSTECTTPNPIGSNMPGQTHPSVVDQVDATALSASGQKRKCALLPLSTSNPNLQLIK